MLECAFWGALSVILYTYVGYPLWIYLHSRVRPRPWQQTPILPSVSIILAVHNGEALLERKIDHLLSLNYPQDKVEIIIISDGSTDRTNEVLQGVRHRRLKAIISEEHRGKAAALNLGIAAARKEILVFIDIRPWLDTDALRLLVSNFGDPKVGCAAGNLILWDDGHDANTKAVGGLYWRYEQWIRHCESKVDSPLGVYGGFYAIRRELATVLPEGTILDDMLQPLSIVRQGFRSILDVRACVNDIWPRTSSVEFHRKVRTLAGNFQLLQLAPWLLTRKNSLRFSFVSHKLLRLAVPFLLLLTLMGAWGLRSASPVYLAAFAAQLAVYVVAALNHAKIPALSRLTGAANAFCVMNAAVIVGFYKFLFIRGSLWKIWRVPAAIEPARSAYVTGKGRVLKYPPAHVVHVPGEVLKYR